MITTLAWVVFVTEKFRPLPQALRLACPEVPRSRKLWTSVYRPA
jgi:hypothetical protein